MFDADEINKRLKQSLYKSSLVEGVKSPVLKCIVTGKQRITNNEYLQTKVKTFGDVNTYMENYISSDALKIFKTSETLKDAFAKLNIDTLCINESRVLTALKYYNVIY